MAQPQHGGGDRWLSAGGSWSRVLSTSRRSWLPCICCLTVSYQWGNVGSALGSSRLGLSRAAWGGAAGTTSAGQMPSSPDAVPQGFRTHHPNRILVCCFVTCIHQQIAPSLGRQRRRLAGAASVGGVGGAYWSERDHSPQAGPGLWNLGISRLGSPQISRVRRAGLTLWRTHP